MKKPGGTAARLAAIGKRQRRRRLQTLRNQRRLQRESASMHDAHLRFLADLCSKLECGHFTPEEITDARAALLQPHSSRQRQLDLHGAR